MSKRSDGRAFDQLRPIKTTYDLFGYACSSVLFELGNTKVNCALTVQNNVPPFLKGKGSGWLTAEYSMLPTSTEPRSIREMHLMKRNGRSIEISRLIGRCLRSIINLNLLGEKTIIIDCDVLQADGGTRVASINGGFAILKRAVEKSILHKNILVDSLVAISAGIVDGKTLVDLNFSEDNKAEADFTFVLTASGKIIEIEGASEKYPIGWKDFESMKNVALMSAKRMFNLYKNQKKESNKRDGFCLGDIINNKDGTY